MHHNRKLSRLATWLALATFDHRHSVIPGPGLFYRWLMDVVGEPEDGTKRDEAG